MFTHPHENTTIDSIKKKTDIFEDGKFCHPNLRVAMKQDNICLLLTHIGGWIINVY